MSMLPPPSPPPPPVPSTAVAPHGGTLVRSAWAALRSDPHLLALPVLGGVVSILAVLPVLVTLAFVPTDSGGVMVALFVAAAFIVALIGTFFAVALAAGAHERMNGGNPTVQSCCAIAWRHRRGVVGWAALSTTVGLLLSFLQSRFRFAGSILRILGGLAWAVASFFAVPIIASNDVGAVEALKLSANTFQQRWSSAVRVQLRLGLYVFGLMAGAVVAVIVVVMLASVSPAMGIVTGVVFGLAFVAGVVLLNAVGSYARVALYRYASGMVTPGFAAVTMEAAVKQKASARR